VARLKVGGKEGKVEEERKERGGERCWFLTKTRGADQRRRDKRITNTFSSSIIIIQSS
jgi:hypothetical protein